MSFTGGYYRAEKNGAVALSLQIDLATDPCWSRVSGTFGESSLLSTDMGREYVDGFQTTESTNGWGTIKEQ